MSIRETVLEADDRWRQRGEQGLQPVLDVLSGLQGEQATDPRVVWRQVRVMTSLGLVDSNAIEARRTWTAARERGVACFESRQGGTALTADRAACAAWGAHAWVRWMVAFGGDAAALDTEPVQDLIGAAGRGGYQSLADWAELLVDAHVLHNPPHTLVQRFGRLVDHAEAASLDDVWLRWADLAQVLPDRAEAHRPTGAPVTPEAVRVVEALNL